MQVVRHRRRKRFDSETAAYAALLGVIIGLVIVARFAGLI